MTAAAGVLLGTFTGDAIGAPWEGRSPTPAGTGELRLEESLAHRPMRYTDDTQMTLALAEHLCATPEVDPEALGRLFVEHFEPDRGYSAGTRRVLDLLRQGTPVANAATAAFPEGSLGNGAAMRVAPVGVVWAHDPDRLVDAARRSAEVTHTHPVAVDGAVAQARAVGFAVARGRFGPQELEEVASMATTPQLREGLGDAHRLCDEDLTDRQPVEAAIELGTAATADRSVPTALWLAATATGFVDGVTRALELGGDIDTIAAMAGAVLGAADGLDAIPSDWLAALEDGSRGRGYALDLATRLASAARPRG